MRGFFLLVAFCYFDAVANTGVAQGVPAMTDIEASQIAHGLIQRHVSPDEKITDMRSFYWALTQALQEAHLKGWKDRWMPRVW
jgi:hypothetical protein